MLASLRVEGTVVSCTGVAVVTTGGVARVALATLTVIPRGASDIVVANTAERGVGTSTLEVAGVRGAGVAVVARVVDRCDAFGILALGLLIGGAGVTVVAVAAFHFLVEGAHALARRALVRGAVIVVVAQRRVERIVVRVALKTAALYLIAALPTLGTDTTLGVVRLVDAAELLVTTIDSAVDAVVAGDGFVDALAAQAGVDGAGVEVFTDHVDQLRVFALHDWRRGQLTTAHAEEADVIAGARIAVVARRRVVGVGATLGHVADVGSAGILVVAIVLAALGRRGDVLTDVLSVVAHVHRRDVRSGVLGGSGILIVQVLLPTRVRRHVFCGVGVFEGVTAGRQCDQHREDRGFHTVHLEHLPSGP